VPALKEGDPQRALGVAEAVRERRLGQIEPASGGGQRALVGDGEQQVEVAQVERFAAQVERFAVSSMP
jgi:hypothetical protein